MRIFTLLAVCAPVLLAQRVPLGPESQPQPGVPKGSLTKYELPPGPLYPGTPHNYWVYVPAQYRAEKPAPFMIFMDGGGAVGDGQRAPVVFDNLIARGELPPLIGIFIDPGVLPAVLPSAQNRFERIFEYDSLSGRWATFLLTELIPAVAKQYNLSKNPDDHALCGVSTGAVAAFAAAWNRPDQFHRVLSFIGTYVAMKGADSLPALIRKTEPKPLRIFLEDGKNDHLAPGQPWGTFYAGSWPVNNEVMYEALEYAGYDAKLSLAEGAHSMAEGGAAMLPDALRWLWREYPKPIVARAPQAMSQPGWDPRGKPYSIVSPDKGWELVSGDAANRYSLPGTGAHPDGSFYAVRREERAIVALDGAGHSRRTLARGVDAGFLAATASGAVYFTDTAKKTIGLVEPDGKVRTVYAGGEIAAPNGVALSADQAMLVVSDAESRYSWSFQIAPDGSLIHGEPFYRLEMPEEIPGRAWVSGVGAVAEDTAGQVYFASPLGIQICEANGRVATLLNPPGPEPIWNLAFSGDWLYVAAGANVYRRPVKVKGAEPWNIVKLPKPPL